MIEHTSSSLGGKCGRGDEPPIDNVVPPTLNEFCITPSRTWIFLSHEQPLVHLEVSMHAKSFRQEPERTEVESRLGASIESMQISDDW